MLAFEEVGKGVLKAVFRNCLWVAQEVRPHLAKPIYERIRGFWKEQDGMECNLESRLENLCLQGSESLFTRTPLMLVGPASARRYCFSPCNVEPT